MLVYKRDMTLLKFDSKRYSKRMDLILGRVIREAAREWLRAVLTSVSGDFPVETGMAKASLIPLGRLLRVAVPVSPTRKPYYSKLEGGMQDVGLGLQKTPTPVIEDDKTHPLRFIYAFEWSTEVLHYYINEFYNVGIAKNAPWHTLEAGDRAFMDYIHKRIIKEFPDFETDLEIV